MVAQTVLPFKLGVTNDRIAPPAGLALYDEFVHALGVDGILSPALHGPGSGAGYQPEAFVMPLLLMLHGGGRTLEDQDDCQQPLTAEKGPPKPEIPRAGERNSIAVGPLVVIK